MCWRERILLLTILADKEAKLLYCWPRKLARHASLGLVAAQSQECFRFERPNRLLARADGLPEKLDGRGLEFGATVDVDHQAGEPGMRRAMHAQVQVEFLPAGASRIGKIEPLPVRGRDLLRRDHRRDRWPRGRGVPSC